MTFGEKLKILSIQKELTQGELARLSGISLRTLINYETYGKSPQKKETYDKLASVLGVNVSYLMQDNDTDLEGLFNQKSLSSVQDKTAFLLTEITNIFNDSKTEKSQKEKIMLSICEAYWRAISKSTKKK